MFNRIARVLSNLKFIKEVNRNDIVFKSSCITGVSSRYQSTSIDDVTKNDTNKAFKPVYYMKDIRVISAICKSQNLTIRLGPMALPVAFTCELLGYSPENATLLVFFSGIAVGTTMGIICWFLSHTVGIIKYDENKKLVQISSINFWGKKIDEEFPIENIAPLSEISYQVPKKFFLPIEIYGQKHRKKLFMRNEYVLDKEKFKEILGES